MKSEKKKKKDCQVHIKVNHYLGGGEGQRGLVCCSPWRGRRKWDTTEQLNNNKWPGRTDLAWPALGPQSEAMEALRQGMCGESFVQSCCLVPPQLKERGFLQPPRALEQSSPGSGKLSSWGHNSCPGSMEGGRNGRVGFFDDGVMRICVHLCPGGTVVRPVAGHFLRTRCELYQGESQPGATVNPAWLP